MEPHTIGRYVCTDGSVLGGALLVAVYVLPFALVLSIKFAGIYIETDILVIASVAVLSLSTALNALLRALSGADSAWRGACSADTGLPPQSIQTLFAYLAFLFVIDLLWRDAAGRQRTRWLRFASYVAAVIFATVVNVVYSWHTGYEIAAGAIIGALFGTASALYVDLAVPHYEWAANAWNSRMPLRHFRVRAGIVHKDRHYYECTNQHGFGFFIWPATTFALWYYFYQPSLLGLWRH